MSEISVIIPAFNVEDYLDECLSSILNQTMKDIEIIVVDDGSTDHSGEVADRYSARDPRVRVIHQKTGGPSAARNTGMKAASSARFMFLDGDDYVKPAFCEKAYRLMKENDADIVCFGFCRNTEMDKNLNETEEGLISGERALVLHAGKKIGDAAWNKIFKRELFKDVEYPVGRHYEDMGTTFRLIEKAERVYVTNEILYIYRDTPGSITKNISEKTRKDLRMMQDVKFGGLLKHFVEEKDVFLDPDVLFYAFEYLITREPGENTEIERNAEIIVNRLKKMTSSLSKDKVRLLWLYFHMRWLFHAVCRMKGYRN